MDGKEEEEEGIDEHLYSRQLYVIGREAQKKLQEGKVLVSGIDGLGMEICKNLVLSGIGVLTIQDQRPVEWVDLSSGFFFTEVQASGAYNRASAAAVKLAELNPYISLYLRTEELREEDVAVHDVVVLVGGSRRHQEKIAGWTRRHGKALVVADAQGLAGYVFCDFGEEFAVTDVNGENPVQVAIASISGDAEGVVTCLGEDQRHGFQDGDVVLLDGIEGMVELNGQERKIRVLGPFTFSIGDTAGYAEYTRGGRAVERKQAVVRHHEDFRTSSLMAHPKFVTTDWGEGDRAAHLHLAFRASYLYQELHGRRPDSHATAEEFLRLCQEVLDQMSPPSSIESLDRKLLLQFAKTCHAKISPVCALLGGVAAQEAMKSISGKFNPIDQWLYYDALECSSELDEKEEDGEGSEGEEVATGDRDFGQKLVLGGHLQSKLADKKIFVVGAGAIGCELLKNLAMMGAGTGPNGMIFITDHDRIEKSNLSRQFLFRPQDVGRSKVLTAAKAIRQMNSRVNVTTFELRIGPETEDVFNDDFWSCLDIVANALDNVQARLYVDEKCVYHGKPLIDSGTLGTKGNVQTIVPRLTESYGASRDPPPKELPMCTLKYYPYAIEHTLQWARELFEQQFAVAPEVAQRFGLDGGGVGSNQRRQQMSSEDLIKVRNFLLGVAGGPCRSPADCVIWARNLWEQLFSNELKQLLHHFPPDSRNSFGLPFWSPPKRCPRPLTFDAEDPDHLLFVEAAATLRAQTVGLGGDLGIGRGAVAAIATTVTVAPFVPSTGVVIPEDDTQIAAESDKGENDLDGPGTAILQLQNYRDLASSAETVEFEKDVDENHHMDFVFSASNLRAANYGIPAADRQTAKLIAGKIIPALATTTSVMAGLACVELLKMVLDDDFRDDGERRAKFKNSFVNLALPFFAFSEPLPPAQSRYLDKIWTQWDCLLVEDGDKLSLGQVIDLLREREGLNVVMMSVGTVVLYMSFMPEEKRQVRLVKTCRDLVQMMTNKPLHQSTRSLNIAVAAEDGEENDLEVPNLKLIL